MQSVLERIWTRVAMSISYEDNHYTTGTSKGGLNGVGGCSRGIIVKALDCRIIAIEFKIQLHYQVHSRTNTREKGMNPLIIPAIGKIAPLLSF